MKKDVIIDAISAIDEKYVIEYVQYETKLSILKDRKKKKTRNLLICAACLGTYRTSRRRDHPLVAQANKRPQADTPSRQHGDTVYYL